MTVANDRALLSFHSPVKLAVWPASFHVHKAQHCQSSQLSEQQTASSAPICNRTCAPEVIHYLLRLGSQHCVAEPDQKPNGVSACYAALR